MFGRLTARMSIIVGTVIAAGLATQATAATTTAATIKVHGFAVPAAEGTDAVSPGTIARGLNGREWFVTFNGSGEALAQATTTGTISKLGPPLAAGAIYPTIKAVPGSSFDWLLGQGGDNLSAISKTGHQSVLTSTSNDNRDLVVGPDAKLYATDNGGFIDQFTITNTPSAHLAHAYPTGSVPATSIASAGGKLFFSDDLGRLYSMTTGGTVKTVKATSNFVSANLHTMTGAADGNLWAISFGSAAGSGYGHTILKISPSTGKVLHTYSFHSTVQLTSITVGPDGALWFPEANGGHIGRMAPKTGKITSYALPRTIKLPATSSPGTSGYGIAAGPGKTVWFTGKTAAGKAAVGEVTGLS
jgi:virginiamycin B lyase